MRTQRREAGFGLVTALFVLVVLAAAAGALLRLSGVEQTTALLSLEATRAYQAARSGLEWAGAHALSDGACPPSTTLTLAEGGLSGFRVQVSCTSSQHTDGTAAETVYQIASTAERGVFGAAGYVRRRVAGTVTDAP
jgi:MSHA biogenesis protein MshP